MRPREALQEDTNLPPAEQARQEAERARGAVHRDLHALLHARRERPPSKAAIPMLGAGAAGIPLVTLPNAHALDALEDLRRTNEATAAAAALAYAGLGLRVVPLHHPLDGGCSCGRADCNGSAGKHPRIDRWQIDASADRERVAAWWRATPDGNVGLVMGGDARLLALDIDGEAGRASLAALEAEYGPLPVTLASRSGRPDGGEHRIFVVPEGVDMAAIRNQAGKLGKGLDVRAEGGQIVVAPSRHKSGARYQWTTLAPIAMLPASVCSRLTARPAPEPPPRLRPSSPGRIDALERASRYLARMDPAISGQGGHQATWRAAVALVRGFDLEPGEALDFLLREYNPRCEPRWSRRELEHKVAGASGAELPRGYLLEDERRPWTPPPWRPIAELPQDRAGQHRDDQDDEDIERDAIAGEPPLPVPPELAPRLARLVLPDVSAEEIAAIAGAAHEALVAQVKTRRRTEDEQAIARHRDALSAGDLRAAHPLLIAMEAKKKGEAPADPIAAARFSMLDTMGTIEPKPWTCRAFQWIPGRPAMGIGYPGAGKTFSLLSALVALSVGRPAWGCSYITGPRDRDTGRPRALRCLVVDIDSGKDDVRGKLGRLVRGMGISAVEIEQARAEIAGARGLSLATVGSPIEGLALSDLPNAGALLLASYNPGDLAAFRDAWTALARGFDIVLIDPLRNLAPFADENDSRIGAVPRELGAASRASEAAFVLVHHAGRVAPTKPNQPAKVPQYSARGSSAIDGAAGAQLVFERDSQGRRKVTMTRDADPDDDEGTLTPLYLTLRRALGEAEVLAQPVEESDDTMEAVLGSSESTPTKEAKPGRGSADVDFARGILQANPGINGTDALVNKICDAARSRGKRRGGPMGTGRAEAAVRVLLSSTPSEIEDRGTAKPKRPRWFWRDPHAPEPGTPGAKAREQAALERAMSSVIPPEGE